MGTPRRRPPWGVRVTNEYAVVDSRGAVYGVTGLSVVDASVIPLAPSAATNLTTVIAGEIALVTAEWEVVGSSVAPSLTGRSAEVLRQAGDGTWAYLIDQPA